MALNKKTGTAVNVTKFVLTPEIDPSRMASIQPFDRLLLSWRQATCLLRFPAARLVDTLLEESWVGFTEFVASAQKGLA
jgi:hypothetical protein